MRMLVALAALTVAVSSVSAQTALLRYKFHPGTTHRYDFGMDMKMNVLSSQSSKAMPMTVGVSGGVKMTVQSVAPDGTATIAESAESMKTEMNGKAFPAGNTSGQSFTIKMTPVGGLEMSQMKAQNMNFMGMSMLSSLPNSPVHAGSTWTSTMDMPGMTGASQSITMHNQVQRIVQSGGSTLAYVHSTGNIDLGKIAGTMTKANGMNMAGSMNADFLYVFNVTKGIIQSGNGGATMSMKMSGAQSASMKGGMRIHMKLLS